MTVSMMTAQRKKSLFDTSGQEKRTTQIGIDPGQTGAIAFFLNDVVVDVFDMPVMARTHGSGLEVNTSELAEILRSRPYESTALLEAVSAMPKQGGTGIFHFGESFGAVKGVLGALGIPYKLVTPQRWKKHYGLIGKEKDVARTLAITRHPEVADKLKRKKDGGRADAILIAAFIT